MVSLYSGCLLSSRLIVNPLHVLFFPCGVHHSSHVVVCRPYSSDSVDLLMPHQSYCLVSCMPPRPVPRICLPLSAFSMHGLANSLPPTLYFTFSTSSTCQLFLVSCFAIVSSSICFFRSLSTVSSIQS